MKSIMVAIIKNKFIVPILFACLNVQASDPSYSDTLAAKQGTDDALLLFFSKRIYATYRALHKKYELPEPPGDVGVDISLIIADPRLDRGGSTTYNLNIPVYSRAFTEANFKRIRERNMPLPDGKCRDSITSTIGDFNDPSLVDEIFARGIHETLELLNDRVACPGEEATCRGHFINFCARESWRNSGVTAQHVRRVFSSVDMTCSCPTTCTWTEGVSELSKPKKFGTWVRKRPQFRTPPGT